MSMAPVDVLHGISPAVADVLVASVWQSLLLTGAVALCFRVIPRVPAGTRSGLWTAVLVLIVLLPAGSMLVPHSFGVDGRAVHVAADWSLGVVCFWAALSVFRLLQLGMSAARLRTLAKSAEPVEVEQAIARLLKLGSRNVLLCSSELVDRPSVIGFFRPRILLSPELLRSLSGPELEQIVLHEMEHLRRGDQWTNLLQQLSVVLLPWNPALLWVNRRLSLERELACDDGVLRATKARKTYAACLVRLAEESMLRRGLSLTLGVLGAFEARARESELVKRVRRILAATEAGVAPVAATGFLRVAMGAVLAGALGLSLLLARSPRLVEFGGTTPTVAAADAAGAPAVPMDRTDEADGAGGTNGAKATLVKATVPGPNRARAVMTRIVMTGATMPRATMTRAVMTRATIPQAAMTRAAVHKVAARPRARRAMQPAVVMEVPVWRERMPVVRPVLTLASIEDSQQLYAAVPWQGGWLLFQL